MDEKYDIIVLGTGLTECILSTVFSMEGKKVLQIDRNNYYGGETASLKPEAFYRKFRPDTTDVPSEMKKSKDLVDLIPKSLMANGEITRFLTQTNANRYLEFKQISGSYYCKDGNVSKMPATKLEALTTGLLSILEKKNLQSFLEFTQGYKDDDESTHQGLNLDTNTVEDVYTKFGLGPETQDIIGSGIALQLDSNYLSKPARETINRVILWASSTDRYGKSPYIYPLHGLSELPQAFSRLGALHGAVYMLDKKVDEILYENGVAVGIRSGTEIAKAEQIICDPSYVKDKVKSVGQIVRVIHLLENHAAESDDESKNPGSIQIVIPHNELGRKHDVYVSVVSDIEGVWPQAIVSTVVETEDPEAEVTNGLDFLPGDYKKHVTVLDKFVTVSNIEEPLSDGKEDQVFISKSYDATSHFESVCDDVKCIYKRITGKELKFKENTEIQE